MEQRRTAEEGAKQAVMQPQSTAEGLNHSQSGHAEGLLNAAYLHIMRRKSDGNGRNAGAQRNADGLKPGAATTGAAATHHRFLFRRRNRNTSVIQ